MLRPDKLPRARWPRSDRLTRNDDIRLTIRRGNCVTGGWFRLFFWRGSPGTTRFTVNVRKKVGNACTRNRQRRRLKESLRLARYLWPERGWGVIIIDRPAPPGLTGQKRQDIIDRLLTRTRELSQIEAKSTRQSGR